MGHVAMCLPFREQEHLLLVTFGLISHPAWPRSFFDTVSQPASLSGGHSNPTH